MSDTIFVQIPLVNQKINTKFSCNLLEESGIFLLLPVLQIFEVIDELGIFHVAALCENCKKNAKIINLYICVQDGPLTIAILY